MRYTTPLPVDKNGNPIPVFIPNTAGTQQLGIADNATVATTTAFSGTSKITAYMTTADICSGTNTITFSSKMDPYVSGKISITIAAGGAVPILIAVSGYAITITHDGSEPTCLAVKTALEAHDPANKLVTMTCTSEAATLDAGAAVTKTYLSGYDDGDTPMIVRICPTAACKVHVGVIAATNATGCGMYIPAGAIEYVALMPAEVISVVGLAPVGGALAYITPARRF